MTRARCAAATAAAAHRTGAPPYPHHRAFAPGDDNVPDLSVDVAGLRTLAHTIRSVRSTLDATRSVIEAGRDDVGDARVHDALDDFEKHWDDGRGQIDKNIEAMIEILDESADAYEKTDTDLATRLTEQVEGGS